MASLATPVVGRMAEFAGTFMCLPLASPATMRIIRCDSRLVEHPDYCTETSMVPEKTVLSEEPWPGAGDTEKLVR